MKRLYGLCIVMLLAACGSKDKPEVESQPSSEETIESISTELTEKQKSPEAKLDDILSSQDQATKGRYNYRHPKETLQFFGIKPGMKVVEILPGEGWYSKILAPYLGEGGFLFGADYNMDMWPNFNFANDEFMAGRKAWPVKWTADAKAWAGEGGAKIEAATLSTIPEQYKGTFDSVLFIRALHNLARFEEKGAYLSDALKVTYDVLSDDGTVGVVQHWVDENREDSWADGSRGYLKKSFVVDVFKKAGFELVGESDINANAKDIPSENDIVWRLPPNFYTSGDDEQSKQAYAEIGESNRMTLLFKKVTK